MVEIARGQRALPRTRDGTIKTFADLKYTISSASNRDFYDVLVLDARPLFSSPNIVLNSPIERTKSPSSRVYRSLHSRIFRSDRKFSRTKLPRRFASKASRVESIARRNWNARAACKRKINRHVESRRFDVLMIASDTVNIVK